MCGKDRVLRASQRAFIFWRRNKKNPPVQIDAHLMDAWMITPLADLKDTEGL